MEDRKIGGLNINKKYKRNEWLYNEFTRLRMMEIDRDAVLTMLVEHEFNSDELRGWHLSLDSIGYIITHHTKRMPVV